MDVKSRIINAPTGIRTRVTAVKGPQFLASELWGHNQNYVSFQLSSIKAQADRNFPSPSFLNIPKK